MLLRVSWGWQSKLDCEMRSSPDTLWMLLARFASMVFSLLDFAWLPKFLQPEQNFFNHPVTVLSSTELLSSQQMFLVSSAMLWSSSNSLSSWIRLNCTFICVTFKSHIEWSHAECISAPTTIMILPTAVSTSYGLRYPRGVMVKVMNCGIVVREFVLQSRYYVHFQANTLGKGMNPLILPPAMGK